MIEKLPLYAQQKRHLKPQEIKFTNNESNRVSLSLNLGQLFLTVICATWKTA